MRGKYVRNEWVDTMVSTLSRLHPEKPKKEIAEFVINLFMERYTDHDALLYDNYENTTAKVTLGGITDWIQEEKPLIAESGVFFYPKDQKRNVNTEIIKECMLDARTIHKGEKFAALDAGDIFTAAVKDIQQANDKKAANSGYGAEGQSSSFLFNVHSAMSVTSCGRGQLSTAIQCFENLFGDSVKFFDMDEFFVWINHIVSEQKEWKFRTADVIDEVPHKKRWVRRFLGKFLHHSLYNEDQISSVYDSLSDELRIRTYYKANMREFLWRNTLPTDLFTEISETEVEFIDPNKIPAELKEPISYLTDLIDEFVGYKYSFFRYEDRARYQKRSVVIVSDTDSTFLAYGQIYKFISTKVLPMKLHRRGKETKEVRKLRVLNTLACFATRSIATTLNNYLGYVNVAEEDRKYIKMKNEFYYSRVIVTYAKKSYVGLMKRQEAHVYDKPKLDVKGVNFFKSTASEKTSRFIYDEVLMGQLLQPKDDKVSLRRTYKTIQNFQRRIAEEIKAGDMGFLKRSIRVKSADAYANPMRISQYKAVYVWNYVNDDKDRITLPDTVTMVKVNLQSKKDVAALEGYPEIYERMMKLFDTEPAIGDHTVITNGKERKVRGNGINAIAIPNEYDEVPEWLLEIIDVDTLVSDNMKLMTQIFRPLGMSAVKATHNKQQMTYYSNIVRI